VENNLKIKLIEWLIIDNRILVIKYSIIFFIMCLCLDFSVIKWYNSCEIKLGEVGI